VDSSGHVRCLNCRWGDGSLRSRGDGARRHFSTSIRSAKDLSPEQKAAIESLLGRRLLGSEDISVCAFEPLALSDERRRELVEQLKKYFAEVDARRKTGSPEEAEDLINEAMRSVRPDYRPHR
jgi:hypothetical protein